PNANNLEQYLVLTWSTLLSQKTSFNFSEAASSSPEVDNFEDRGVDQGLTVAARARQIRNMTTVGMTTLMSQRWSFRGDYNFRFLDNGKIERPENAAPPTTECNGGFCIPGPGGEGDGTSNTLPPITIENLSLLDERGHTVNLGLTRQMSASSDLT